MASNTPKKDGGLFGNIFDLNGDGRTDAAETALMFMTFNEMQKEEERKRRARASGTYALGDTETDLDDLDIEGI